VIVFLVLALIAAPFGYAQQTKKLIEFGWDEPDTAFMRQHVAQMEETPFDGTVFHVLATNPDGSAASFMNECWGKRAFKGEQFAKALEDLQATPLKKFKYNFLRFNVCPGDVDWFDDFNAVVNNVNAAAKLAAAGQAKGILFDIEQYNTHLFDYRKARDARTKTFEQYAAQARLRGREVMNAFQDGFPDVTVFLTYGYSLPYVECAGKPEKLPTTEYGLLAAFLDGMFDVARGDSRIIDGFENSYGYKTDAQFDNAGPLVKNTVLPVVGAKHDEYLKRLSLGFGLWMDFDWRNKGWDAKDASKNYFTPAQFQQSVHKALSDADEYVWIYTEEAKWWTAPKGAAEKLPDAYIEAVRKAREQ
jgi:hypothetical protein